MVDFIDSYIKIIRDEKGFRYLEKFWDEKERRFNTVEELKDFLIRNACPYCNPPVIHAWVVQISDRLTHRFHMFTSNFYSGIKLPDILSVLEEMFR